MGVVDDDHDGFAIGHRKESGCKKFPVSRTVIAESRHALHSGI